MKKNIFKHLLNTAIGTACAAILMSSSISAIPVPETGTKQEPSIQKTLSLETIENEPEILPQNNMDDTTFNKK